MKHYPRYDTTVCPNRAECERIYHPQLMPGDCCECCGAMIGDDS